MQFFMTPEEYTNDAAKSKGRCIACGCTSWGVPHNARNRKCHSCGEMELTSVTELMLMHMINITGE